MPKTLDADSQFIKQMLESAGINVDFIDSNAPNDAGKETTNTSEKARERYKIALATMTNSSKG
jgi:hypothetical protein